MSLRIVFNILSDKPSLINSELWQPSWVLELFLTVLCCLKFSQLANANNAELASYLLVRGTSSLMFEKPSYLLSPIIFVSFWFFIE